MLLLSGGLPQPSPIKQPKGSTCSLAPGRCVSRCAVSSSSSSSQAEHQEQQQQQRKTGRRRQQQQQQQKDAQPATRQQQQRAKPPASSSNTPGGGRKQGTHVRKPRKLAPTPAPLGAAPAAQALPAPPQAFPISTLKSPFFNVRFKTFQQLQHLTVVHGPSARIADITAMMSRLKHADWPSTADKAALLQALWQLLRPQLGHAAPRHCAEAMLTASKLGQEAPEGLYEDCMQQFVQQVSLVANPSAPACDQPIRAVTLCVPPVSLGATAPGGCKHGFLCSSTCAVMCCGVLCRWTRQRRASCPMPSTQQP